MGLAPTSTLGLTIQALGAGVAVGLAVGGTTLTGAAGNAITCIKIFSAVPWQIFPKLLIGAHGRKRCRIDTRSKRKPLLTTALLMTSSTTS